MLFVTQRADAERLTFAADIDSAYARAVQSAEQAGVTLLCYRCRVDVDGIGLADAIPITSPTPAPD
jgi:sugar fermentation stimulation protein A